MHFNSTSWLAEAANWNMGIPMYNLLLMLTSRPAGWPAALSATSVDSRSSRRPEHWIKWTRLSWKHELKHEYIKWKLPFHFVYCTSYFFFFSLAPIRQGRTMVRSTDCMFVQGDNKLHACMNDLTTWYLFKMHNFFPLLSLSSYFMQFSSIYAI